jgi:hypothetical protein
MSNQSHKTAITRTRISAPARFLMEAGLVSQYSSRWLDYGCGKGNDADSLRIEKFDPHFFPEIPAGKFDTITCTYVLNTIESKKEQCDILLDILDRLNEGGQAFVTVRRDVKTKGMTKRGTYQENVQLGLLVVKETAAFCIYRIDK